MEVKIRYLGHGIAKHFGSHKKRETIHLPDNTEYRHLLDLLEKRYEKTIKQLHGGRWKDRMLESFIFICGGTPLRRQRDKVINPNGEVLVAYMDFGG